MTMATAQNIGTPQEAKKKNQLLWISFLFFMLGIFWLTSPFMFYMPVQVDFAGGIAAAEVQFTEGNIQRRIGMFILLGVMVTSLAWTKNRFRVNGLGGGLVLAYLFWIMSSLVWAVAPDFTLRRLVVVTIIWISSTIFAAQISIREFAILAVFVTGMTALIGFGNELYLGTISLVGTGWRFSGVFHCVQMSWNCGILIISTMFLLSGEEKMSRRVLLWIILLIGIFFLIYTKTRSTTVATLLAMVICWSRQVSLRNRLFQILLALIFLGTVYMFIGTDLFGYAQKATYMGRGEGVQTTVGNLTGRVPLWEYSMKYFYERPVLGMGFSSFVNVETIAKIYREVGWAPSSIHSAYFNELIGTGLIGLCLFLSMMTAALIKAYHWSLRYPAYNYFVAVIIWASIIYVMEASLENGMTFMAFFVNAVYARLAFIPPEDPV